MAEILLGYEIRHIQARWFEVTSPAGRRYMVNLDKPSCDCADFSYRGERSDRPSCKHIRLVLRSRGGEKAPTSSDAARA